MASLVGVERMSRKALDPAIKSGNYLNNILGLAEAKARGAYEAIFLNPQGQVVEGSTCNVFLVKAGVVATPALEGGLLPGITRRRVLDLASSLGLATQERVIERDELATADELFVTSSLRGVLPISRMDDRGLPVGPITKRLMTAYQGFLAECARVGGFTL
jgi:branched-subunit amino acid aminotransferase/4-amino-4-deoxychorismate lyase